MLSRMQDTIIVGYDDKEPAKRALEQAIAEARKRGGRLVVLAVEEMPLDPADPRYFGTLDDGPVELGLAESPELHQVLADARTVVEPSGIEADYVWAAGDPGHEIVELAKNRGAGLIVIGGHHAGILARTFGMSIQDEVKKHADCEVLVVE
jgi:nucleotide-binding universal stress UspA family protein